MCGALLPKPVVGSKLRTNITQLNPLLMPRKRGARTHPLVKVVVVTFSRQADTESESDFDGWIGHVQTDSR